MKVPWKVGFKKQLPFSIVLNKNEKKIYVEIKPYKIELKFNENMLKRIENFDLTNCKIVAFEVREKKL